MTTPTNFAFQFVRKGHEKDGQYLAAFSHLGAGAVLTPDKEHARLFVSSEDANAWFDRVVAPHCNAPEEMQLIDFAAERAYSLHKIVRDHFASVFSLSDPDSATVLMEDEHIAVILHSLHNVYHFQAGSDDDELNFHRVAPSQTLPAVVTMTLEQVDI